MQNANLAADMREAVASAVRAEMARRRVTQTKLAALTGLTQPYISRRMTSETAFDVEDLALIAAALGVPVTTLMPADEKAA